MKACIVTIGNELIDGSRLDTNSKWISDKILKHGIATTKIISIGDDQAEITEVVLGTANKYDYIFITGGLGPTHDDITVSSFKLAFNLPQQIDEEYLQQLESMFSNRGVRMPKINENQAIVLEGCEIIQNPIGTARGIYYKYLKSQYFIMPGVPKEMYNMMEKNIIPSYLGEEVKQNIKTVRTSGIAESKLAEKVQSMMLKYHEDVLFSFLPSYRGVDFVLKTTDPNLDITKIADEFYHKMKPYSFGYNQDSFKSFILNQLSKKDLSIALAESCTGGLLSKMLTDTPGSSKAFLGSVIAYSNEVKINQLGISKSKIDKYGAVSSEIAVDMACNIRDIFKSDLGLSITGIAGPKSDDSNKDVGLVYFGISFKDMFISRKFNFNLNRDMNRKFACYAALNIVRKTIDEHA